MLGYDHDTFWKQTPRTLSLTFEAANEVLRRRHNDRAWLAWHIAGLGRSKKIPSLNTLQVKNVKPLTMEEQIDGLRQFVIATGGKVIYRPREKIDG